MYVNTAIIGELVHELLWPGVVTLFAAGLYLIGFATYNILLWKRKR
jgi:hypothetical protein